METHEKCPVDPGSYFVVHVHVMYYTPRQVIKTIECDHNEQKKTFKIYL